jgi:hypothetical protein
MTLRRAPLAQGHAVLRLVQHGSSEYGEQGRTKRLKGVEA